MYIIKNRLQLIATGFYQFLNILKKRQPATATSFESGQPQPMVQLQSVAFGPVSVIFLVLATGPLNTIYNHFLKAAINILLEGDHDLCVLHIPGNEKNIADMLSCSNFSTTLFLVSTQNFLFQTMGLVSQ